MHLIEQTHCPDLRRPGTNPRGREPLRVNRHPDRVLPTPGQDASDRLERRPQLATTKHRIRKTSVATQEYYQPVGASGKETPMLSPIFYEPFTVTVVLGY